MYYYLLLHYIILYLQGRRNFDNNLISSFDVERRKLSKCKLYRILILHNNLRETYREMTDHNKLIVNNQYVCIFFFLQALPKISLVRLWKYIYKCTLPSQSYQVRLEVAESLYLLTKTCHHESNTSYFFMSLIFVSIELFESENHFKWPEVEKWVQSEGFRSDHLLFSFLLCYWKIKFLKIIFSLCYFFYE